MAPKPPAAQRPSQAWDALTPALSEWILDAIDAMGFKKPTPVQASTIPLFLGHKDVVVEAVTGSGKTLAFLIPMVERLLRLSSPIKKHHVGGIIISPTRELASQIHSVLVSLLAFHAPSAAALNPPSEVEDSAGSSVFPASALKVIPQLILGGTTTPAQDLSTFLKTSPNLVIATPGRLLELLSSQHVHCSQDSFEALIMDEADRLLDLGFKDDLTKIIQRLPKQRRTGLFSASVSEAVDQLVRVGLRNPVRVAVKVKGAGAVDKRTPASLQMSYIVAEPNRKFPAIVSLLGNIQPIPQKAILYMSTCYSVDYFQHILPKLLPEITVIPLHGKHPDNVRRKNFVKFSDSTSPVILLTTDVAARGLDIPSVDLVIQLDPPSDPKTFIHRCGRAGRAGRKGLAVTFLTPGREEDYIEFLRVRQTPITPLTTPGLDLRTLQEDLITKQIRDIVLSDRALYEKAQRGFVSWVQAYSKHAASSIFRVADLNWEHLAAEWGLLRLPKMPELRKWDGDRSLGLTIDWKNYAYNDKVREKARKAEMEEREKALEAGEGDPSLENGGSRKRKAVAWSAQKDARATREQRREKRQARREHERVAKMTDEEKVRQEELDGMIAVMRRQAAEQEGMEDEEFEGFGD